MLFLASIVLLQKPKVLLKRGFTEIVRLGYPHNRITVILSVFVFLPVEVARSPPIPVIVSGDHPG